MESFRKIEKIIKGKEVEVFEREPEEKKVSPKDNRLSESEALLYQEYTAKKEGVAFSERGSEESYKEVEKLIEKLRESEFDWLNIDWSKINLDKLGSLEEAEDRLDLALRLLNSREDPESKKSLSQYLNDLKNIVLPLIVSGAILLGEPNDSFSDDFKKKFKESANNIEKAEKDPAIDAPRRFYTMVEQWKDKYPDIMRIKLDVSFLISEVKKDGTVLGVDIATESVASDANLNIIFKDGRELSCSGHDTKSPGLEPILSEIIEIIERGLKKTGFYTPNLQKFGDSEIAKLQSHGRAINEAFTQCEQKLVNK